MRLMVSNRQTGKTTRMVNYLLAHPDAKCLVHSAMEADRLCRTYGLKPDRFLLPSNYEERLRGQRDLEIAIDNLDLFLKYLIPHNQIVLATMTADLVKETEA